MHPFLPSSFYFSQHSAFLSNLTISHNPCSGHTLSSPSSFYISQHSALSILTISQNPCSRHTLSSPSSFYLSQYLVILSNFTTSHSPCRGPPFFYIKCYHFLYSLHARGHILGHPIASIILINVVFISLCDFLKYFQDNLYAVIIVCMPFLYVRWEQYTIPVATAALTKHTRFRWRQLDAALGGNWAIDSGECDSRYQMTCNLVVVSQLL